MNGYERNSGIESVSVVVIGADGLPVSLFEILVGEDLVGGPLTTKVPVEAEHLVRVSVHHMEVVRDKEEGDAHLLVEAV
jgi:hypothetical protein